MLLSGIPYLFEKQVVECHDKTTTSYLNKWCLTVGISLISFSCSCISTKPVAVKTDPTKAPPTIKRTDLFIARNK